MPLSMIYANENFSFTILNIIRWTILKNERVRRKKQSKCLFLEIFTLLVMMVIYLRIVNIQVHKRIVLQNYGDILMPKTN